MLITCDGAGSTHALIEHISALNTQPGAQVHYSVGFDFNECVRAVTGKVPATAWAPALDVAGNPRQDAQVAELTGLLRHSPATSPKPNPQPCATDCSTPPHASCTANDAGHHATPTAQQ